MSDDLGADFLKGYFDMARYRQDKQNAAASARDMAQQLQMRQQEFQLNQQKFDAEQLYQAGETAHRKAQEAHQSELETASQQAADFAKAKEGFSLQVSGQGAPAPAQPVNGLPLGVVLPPSTGLKTTTPPQGAVDFGNAGYLRPVGPAEQAGQAQAIKGMGAQADFTQKLQFAQDTVANLVKAYPKSSFATDKELQSKVFAHLSAGLPFEDKEGNMQDLAAHATKKHFDTQFNDDISAPDKAKEQAQFNAMVPVLSHFISLNAGIGSKITTSHEDAVLNHEATDTAEVRERAAQMEKAGNVKANDTTGHNAAVNAAAVAIGKERAAQGKPPLHPKATTNVLRSEEQGLTDKAKPSIFEQLGLDPTKHLVKPPGQ